LPPEHLLRDYLYYVADCLEAEQPEDRSATATRFERAVAATLRDQGDYTVFVGYPVAGFSVDLVVQRGTQALAIACDGEPERPSPVPGVPSLDTSAGQAILERAGWRVYRTTYRRWEREREACLAEIDALLGGGNASAEETVAAEE
jgi:hypothetical protein